jgi:predicted RNA-binding protein associated with RNAse of E/G family
MIAKNKFYKITQIIFNGTPYFILKDIKGRCDDEYFLDINDAKHWFNEYSRLAGV